MTHQELADAAAAYALDALDAAERRAFEAHLADCDACQAEVAAFRETAASLAYALPPASPADDEALRERLLARAERAVAPPITIERSRRLSMIAWLAAAAAIVLSIASVFGYRVERDARSRAVAQLAAARAELRSRDSVLAAFLGPEVHVVSLSEPARKPSVRVFWNHTRNIFIVTAFGLPPAPQGKTYQLWALAKGKVPVSMATFDVDARGRVAMVVPVARNVTETGYIDDCGLTVEPAGGSLQPTESPRLIGAWRHTD